MDLSKISEHGSLQYSWSNFIDVTYQELVVRDEYRLKWARDNLPQLRTIVDIGGNLGMFAIFARELFPDGRIISVEACDDTYKLLKRNTVESNVETHNFAMGDGRRLYLNKCPAHSGGNQMVTHTTDDVVGVESHRLCSIFDMCQVEAPYMVKIDIEGGEAFLYDDPDSSNILKQAELVAIEFHVMPSNPSHVFNSWVSRTFKDFDVSNAGAVYTMIKRGGINNNF